MPRELGTERGQLGVRRHAIEDGKLYARTVFNDDVALERNKQIRAAGLINKAKLNLHDQEDIRMVISCPDTLQWSLFKRDFPDIARNLHSKCETERMSACKQLQILHPEWVLQERL